MYVYYIMYGDTFAIIVMHATHVIWVELGHSLFFMHVSHFNRSNHWEWALKMLNVTMCFGSCLVSSLLSVALVL